MPFPEFAKIAKNVTDLLDFENQTKLTFKRKTASGVVIETETVSAAKLAGKVKGVVNDKALGELTVEAETNGQLSTKAKLTELAKDVVVNLEHSVGNPKNSGVNQGSVAASFTQPQFVVTGKFSVVDTITKTDKDGKKVDTPRAGSFQLSTIGGIDFFTAGLNVNTNVLPDRAVADYNIALKYAKDDTFAAVTTEKKCQHFNLFLKQQLNKSTAVGLKAYRLAEAPKEDSDSEKKGVQQYVTVGVEHWVDKDTTVKFSANSCGSVNAQIKHVLSNPALRVTLSGAFKPTFTNYAASSVNLALAFGEN